MSDVVKFGKYRGKSFTYVKINDDDSYRHYLSKNLKKLKENNQQNANDLLDFLNKNTNIKNLKKYIEMPNIIDKNSEMLMCPICLETCTQLKQTRCGHTFCSGCIHNSLKINPLCPICRNIISAKSIMNIPIILKNIIGEIKCECPYNSDGCDKVINYKNLYDHIKECKYSNTCDIQLFNFFNNMTTNKSLKTLYKELREHLQNNNLNCTFTIKQFVELLEDCGYCILNNTVEKIFSEQQCIYWDCVEIFDTYSNYSVFNI